MHGNESPVHCHLIWWARWRSDEFPHLSAPWQEPLQAESRVSSLGWKLMNGLPVLSSSCLDATRGLGDEHVSVYVCLWWGLGGDYYIRPGFRTSLCFLSGGRQSGFRGPARRQSIEPIWALSTVTSTSWVSKQRLEQLQRRTDNYGRR